MASGEVNKYSYDSSLVVAPTKKADADEWQRDIKVELKPGVDKLTSPDKDKDSDKGKTPATGSTSSSSPKTGDGVALVPLCIAASVSAVLLLAIALGRLCRRRRE